MICTQIVSAMITKETKTMTESLNDHTAKLLMYHVHKIGMDLTAFESALHGTAAHTPNMNTALVWMKKWHTAIRQEIIDLRDGKS